jgi:hypothetical protein
VLPCLNEEKSKDTIVTAVPHDSTVLGYCAANFCEKSSEIFSQFIIRASQ